MPQEEEGGGGAAGYAGAEGNKEADPGTAAPCVDKKRDCWSWCQR